MFAWIMRHLNRRKRLLKYMCVFATMINDHKKNKSTRTSKSPKNGGGPRNFYLLELIGNMSFRAKKFAKIEGYEQRKKVGPRKRGVYYLNLYGFLRVLSENLP